MTTRSRSRRLRVFASALLLAFVVALPAHSNPPTDKVEFRITLNEAVNQMWVNMPQDSSSPSVNLLGNTQPDCANSALRKAKAAVTWVTAREGAITALGKTIDIGKDILEEVYGVKYVGILLDLANAYLQSNSVEELEQKLGEVAVDQATGKAFEAGGEALEDTKVGNIADSYVHKKAVSELAKAMYNSMFEGGPAILERDFEDPNCGPIHVVLELSKAERGRMRLTFTASGNCRCQWPTNRAAPERMGRFIVHGVGILEPQDPVVEGSTIVIGYRLGTTNYDVMASCGCNKDEEQSFTDPGQGSGTSVMPDPTPRNVTEEICWRRCGDLYRAWQQALRDAESAERHAANLEREVAQLERELQQEQQNLADARRRLDAANTSIANYEAEAKRKGVAPEIFGSGYRDAQTSKRSAEADVRRLEGRVRRFTEQLNTLRPLAQRARARAAQLAAAAKAAEDAYYRCASSCYEQAQMANPNETVPSEILEWRKTHPRTEERPATGTQVSSVPAGTKGMLVGVVVADEPNRNSQTSVRVVTDPKTYTKIPGLKVIEMTMNVPVDEKGVALLEHLKVKVGDGTPQPGSSCATGKVPSSGDLHVQVTNPAGETGTGTIPTSDKPAMGIPSNPTARDFRTDAVIQPGKVVAIHGPFTGNANETQVMIGGKQATIIAQEQGTTYVRVPDDVPDGPTEIVCQQSGVASRMRPVSVSLSMSADKLNLQKGESTAYHVTVGGLNGLPASAWQAGEMGSGIDGDLIKKLAPRFKAPAKGQPGVVLLLLENMTTSVVSMDKTNRVALELKQGDFASGAYTYHGRIQSFRAGNFSINGTVIPFLSPIQGEPVQ